MLEPSLLAPFITRLDELGILYMITGSTAGTLYGEPRMTHDVDFVVALSARVVHAFVEAFPIDHAFSPTGSRAFASRRSGSASRRADAPGFARRRD